MVVVRGDFGLCVWVGRQRLREKAPDRGSRTTRVGEQLRSGMNNPSMGLTEEETDMEKSLLLSILQGARENYPRLWEQFC